MTTEVRSDDFTVAQAKARLGLRFLRPGALGLGVGWLEAGEFCTLTMPGGDTVLSLATDHSDRISDDARSSTTKCVTTAVSTS
jgi:hypothetical protein